MEEGDSSVRLKEESSENLYPDIEKWWSSVGCEECLMVGLLLVNKCLSTSEST